MDELIIPRNLADNAAHDGREPWLMSLPAALRAARELWSIEVSDPFQPGGQTAWVAPARGPAGQQLAVKLIWPSAEEMDEAAGLTAWNGDGAVRLIAEADFGDTIALLLEECVPGTPLAQRPEAEQDVVIAGLLRRLWIEPGAEHTFRPLRVMCEQWAAEAEQRFATDDVPLDPGLVRAGLQLFRELPASAEREVLLCTDLHAENVLAARREPWLVIDPKPHVGDPTYDALQHMLNCYQRLEADPRGFARRMAGLLTVDADRLLLWLFARCVQESPGWPGHAVIARQIAPR